jgi:hypothetical protein
MENNKQKDINKLKLNILFNYFLVVYVIYSLLIGIQYVLPVCDTFGCMTITEFSGVYTNEGITANSGRYYSGSIEGGRAEYCSKHSDFLGSDQGILSSLLSIINFLGYLFTFPFVFFFICFNSIFTWSETIDIIFRIGYALVLAGLGVFFLFHSKGILREALNEIPDLKQKIHNLDKGK